MKKSPLWHINLLKYSVSLIILVLLLFFSLEQAVAETANGKIAFTSTRDGNHEIYSMNADGSNQTRLTNNAAADDNPAWSPDGTKIAFTSIRDGNYEIYIMNANGSSQTNLTNNVSRDDYPAWSPDGIKIAFTSHRAGGINDEIYVMNTNGSSQINLSNNAASDYDPSWKSMIISEEDTPLTLPTTGSSNYLLEVMTIIFVVISSSLLLRRLNVK